MWLRLLGAETVRKVTSVVRSGEGMPFFHERAVISGDDADCGRSRVWRQYNIDSDGGARAFFVGSTSVNGRLSSLARSFVAERISVDLCNDFEESLEAIASSSDIWCLLVVDVDHVERDFDLEAIVNDLVEFREHCRDVAIVLLSHGFATNESDLVRASIADYCFRASVNDASIMSALPHVFENHQTWVHRCQEASASSASIGAF